MIIQTKADWWAEAQMMQHYLPDYAAHFNLEWPTDEAWKLIEAGDHEKLHSLYEQLWSDLPDSPSIHFHPFGQLCDLCSEYWPFQEEYEANHADEPAF